MPLRKRTPNLIGAFSSQLDDIESHLWRKDRCSTRARSLIQASYALIAKAPGPFSEIAFSQTDLPGRENIAISLLEKEQSAGASHQASRHFRAAQPPLEQGARLVVHRDL